MWHYFSYITFSAIFLWAIASIFIYRNNKQLQKLGYAFHSLATLLVGFFVIALWVTLDRPPLRTLAETRLWYAFFMGLIGLVIYQLYRQKWMLNYSALMGTVFLLVTFFKPDTTNKTLMPALQSVWFVPHVVVYIFAYAMLGMATLVALYGILRTFKKSLPGFGKIKYEPYTTEETIEVVDRLINIGYAFLTLGLLFGALWAKEAWGHYWTWDPKETWAFISWIGYLSYIHYRYKYKNRNALTNFSIVVASFLLLLICWFGVNYLPTASMSVHTYSG
ncbi:MAG: cytochrome C assembly protein [Niabella sp.]|nr:MAG: cytochrome C assembly protein [Niabella sp.]